MEVFCGIVGAERLHGDVVLGDREAVRNSLGHEFEDLLLGERLG